MVQILSEDQSRGAIPRAVKKNLRLQINLKDICHDAKRVTNNLVYLVLTPMARSFPEAAGQNCPSLPPPCQGGDFSSG